jgi:hypothetical protein
MQPKENPANSTHMQGSFFRLQNTEGLTLVGWSIYRGNHPHLLRNVL